MSKDMLFVSKRNRMVASTMGHTIEFKAGEPTYVPPLMHKEVMDLGIDPVDDDYDPEADKKASGAVQRPVDPKELQAAVFVAFEKVLARGVREEFDASSAPHVKAVIKETGWKVTQKERDAFWTEFMNRGKV